MVKLVIELSPKAYEQLRQRAEQSGQSPEALAGALLEAALQAAQAQPTTASTGATTAQQPGAADRPSAPPGRTTREILAAAGHLRPLGPTLERLIIPGVTLDELHEATKGLEGPLVSEIILEQRGPKE
jgi:hypothetical protein